MQPVPRTITDKFAKAFGGKSVGFSAKEITEYFTNYSNIVKPYDHYGLSPTREQLFVDSVYALPTKMQYYALNDLAFYERDSKYTYPNKGTRDELLEVLHCFISSDPIGLRISTLRETAYREDWMIAQSRLENNPAAAITASRTMLETVCKTIITERGSASDDSGELQKLLKQAQDSLGFKRPENPAEHQMIAGMVSVIQGLSTISNSAGDRHGSAVGKSMDDPAIARLCLNCAGTVGLFLIEMHLLTQLGK